MSDDGLTHIERVLDKLDGVRRSGSGWKAHCPAHHDLEPSLHVSIGDDDKILLHCHAGCDWRDVCEKGEIDPRDLFPPKDRIVKQNGHGRHIANTYDYRDEQGELLYQVVRYEPKGFSQRRLIDGQWVNSLGDVQRVLYRLPELLAADPEQWVLIPEGEKDVDRLIRIGFVATTNVGGAGKKVEEYVENLRGRKIALMPDNDVPGDKHTDDWKKHLTGVAAEVRIVRLPGLPEKGDISDWLDAGGTADKLNAILASPAPDPGLTTPRNVDYVVASDVEPEDVTFIWKGRLADGKITIVDGDPSLGKSTATLDIAARMTRGGPMPDGTMLAAARGVVLLSAEDGLADTIVPRLKVAGADLTRVVALRGVVGNDGTVEGFTLPENIADLEDLVTHIGAGLVVLDPLVAYLDPSINANKDQDVRRALAPLAEMLERTGCAAILVRHLNKTESRNAITRGGGSIGIIGAARFGMLFARDPENDEARIVATSKCNLGKEQRALGYRLVGVPGTDVARVEWDTDVPHYSANDLLEEERGSEERLERDEAVEWLREYLARGPQPSGDVQREAKRIGLSERALKRARKVLQVRAGFEGFGKEGHWSMWLPAHDTSTPGQASASSVSVPLSSSDPQLGERPSVDGETPTNRHKDEGVRQVPLQRVSEAHRGTQEHRGTDIELSDLLKEVDVPWA